MRRLLILSLCLILINALAILAMRAIGSHIETPESRLFATGDCSQPCWHGIQPGKTTIDQAEAILRSEPDFITNIKTGDSLLTCKLEWTFIGMPDYWGGCINATNGIITDMWVGTNFVRTGIDFAKVIGDFSAPIAAEICPPSVDSAATMYLNHAAVSL